MMQSSNDNGNGEEKTSKRQPLHKMNSMALRLKLQKLEDSANRIDQQRASTNSTTSTKQLMSKLEELQERLQSSRTIRSSVRSTTSTITSCASPLSLASSDVQPEQFLLRPFPSLEITHRIAEGLEDDHHSDDEKKSTCPSPISFTSNRSSPEWEQQQQQQKIVIQPTIDSNVHNDTASTDDSVELLITPDASVEVISPCPSPKSVTSNKSSRAVQPKPTSPSLKHNESKVENNTPPDDSVQASSSPCPSLISVTSNISSPLRAADLELPKVQPSVAPKQPESPSKQDCTPDENAQASSQCPSPVSIKSNKSSPLRTEHSKVVQPKPASPKSKEPKDENDATPNENAQIVSSPTPSPVSFESNKSSPLRTEQRKVVQSNPASPKSKEPKVDNDATPDDSVQVSSPTPSPLAFESNKSSPLRTECEQQPKLVQPLPASPSFKQSDTLDNNNDDVPPKTMSKSDDINDMTPSPKSLTSTILSSPTVWKLRKPQPQVPKPSSPLKSNDSRDTPPDAIAPVSLSSTLSTPLASNKSSSPTVWKLRKPQPLIAPPKPSSPPKSKDNEEPVQEPVIMPVSPLRDAMKEDGALSWHVSNKTDPTEYEITANDDPERIVSDDEDLESLDSIIPNPFETIVQRVSKLKQEAHEYLNSMVAAAADDDDSLLSATNKSMDDLHSIISEVSKEERDHSDGGNNNGTEENQNVPAPQHPQEASSEFLESSELPPLDAAAPETGNNQDLLQTDVEAGNAAGRKAPPRKSVSFDDSDSIHFVERRNQKCSRQAIFFMLAFLFLGAGAAATIFVIRSFSKKK